MSEEYRPAKKTEEIKKDVFAAFRFQRHVTENPINHKKTNSTYD
jgi:hypothetical protein